MAILNSVQRRSVSGRILLFGFYVVLVTGAVTMVYPFLMMLSGSLRSEIDTHQSGLVPRYLFDEAALFQKFTEQRYGRMSIASAQMRLADADGNRLFSFDRVALPKPVSTREMADWQDFLSSVSPQWPEFFRAMGHTFGIKSVSEVGFRYMKQIEAKFPKVPNDELVTAIYPEEWFSRNFQPVSGPFAQVYQKMRAALPDRYFYPVSLDGVYRLNHVEPAYGTGPEAVAVLNRDWGSHYTSTADVTLRARLPDSPPERALWSDFVRNTLSSRFLAFEDELLPAYQQALREKYGELALFVEAYGTNISDWSSIRFPQVSSPPVAFADTDEFLKSIPELTGIAIRSPETEWREHLASRYGTIAKLNEAWGTQLEKFEQISMPIATSDYWTMRAHRQSIIGELVTRNYRFAWNRIALNGTALRNTVIFCLLNVLIALIVNPLAAYGLSRFRPRWGQVALFLLMATMAFPTEVTQIPTFLLLRDLGWLNTFAALVIPAAANGYSIFLLKGFFDSLPKDLYEASEIDGCGEIRAFFTITVPLSTPILAVVALAAFTAAYGAFMFALLVCQKQSMWTLMVYLYQMQQLYQPPVVFAALVIAAIPTLLVFIFCQNIIMRGIVVPVEK